MLKERYSLDNGYVAVETEKNGNFCIMSRKEFNKIKNMIRHNEKLKNKKAA